MYPLAALMAKRGYNVTGTDRSADPRASLTKYLELKRSAGRDRIDLIAPGSADWQSVRLLVYSLAVDEGDPDILAAKQMAVPMISRAQLLGYLMSLYPIRISVSGSHGKSTTTSLIEHLLRTAGIDPTAVSGAELTGGASYREGRGDVFVAEACEYKDSFLSLCPTHQLITSVELDHTDYFPTLEALKASFLTAAKRAQTLVIGGDDPVCREIVGELSEHRGTVLTYGRSTDLDYRLCDIERLGDRTRFCIRCGEWRIGLETSLIGEYNLYNVTAAVAVAHTLGLSDDAIAGALVCFTPPGRRMTRIGTYGTVPVFYDYAHHPTELGAVIGALKERYGSVCVIFRPHTYTRTKSLWNEFIVELCKADLSIILDIYPAREKAIEGVTSENLAKCIPGAIYASPSDSARIALCSACGAVALLGAGEVEGVREDLIKLSKTGV